MTRSVIALLIFLMSSGLVAAQDSADVAKKVPEITQWYYEHYPFVTQTDSTFTFESEFVWPDGFHRPDSSEQTPFQNWVSHFPLWHRWKAVGHWKGGKLYERDEVSRPIHLPWKGDRFTDQAIPLRILGEWLFYRHRESEFRILPKKGDTLRYEEFLGGDLLYNNRMQPFFKPSERRQPSPREFYRFMGLCLEHTDYRSLAANCVSVKADDLMPGDLLIAENENGRKGRVYIVMLKVVNDKGDKRYVVGCGCEEACDFHIPLLTGDKDKPWVSVAEIEQLAPEYPRRGFYRLRIQ